MLNTTLIIFGKILSWTFRKFNLGNGSTWPGHIALKANSHFIKQMLKINDLEVILVAGTNGKTTTSLMIRTILEKNGKKVIQNQSGANLLNGIASTLILNSRISGHIDADFAIFEIDENALPQILKNVTPNYLILLNLFRDQLDRYGEVHIIAERWKEALMRISDKTNVILNADDPEIAHLGTNTKLPLYFGLDDENLHEEKEEHAADTMYCPNCGSKLQFTKHFFSHLGDWQCSMCNLKRPNLNISEFSIYPLSGTYNKYNTLGCVLLAKKIGFSESEIINALRGFKPAFGRQEIIDIKDKKIQIFLSKNPTGFNESLRTVRDLDASTILLVLNDRIADGTDVSWIWDIDIDIVSTKVKSVFVSGERAYDMGLLVKYGLDTNTHLEVTENLSAAIEKGLNSITPGETLYVLPTYTAMLEVRKIITGKKIL